MKLHTLPQEAGLNEASAVRSSILVRKYSSSSGVLRYVAASPLFPLPLLVCWFFFLEDS